MQRHDENQSLATYLSKHRDQQYTEHASGSEKRREETQAFSTDLEHISRETRHQCLGRESEELHKDYDYHESRYGSIVPQLCPELYQPFEHVNAACRGRLPTGANEREYDRRPQVSASQNKVPSSGAEICQNKPYS